jgi:hypothetical protein
MVTSRSIMIWILNVLPKVPRLVPACGAIGRRWNLDVGASERKLGHWGCDWGCVLEGILGPWALPPCFLDNIRQAASLTPTVHPDSTPTRRGPKVVVPTDQVTMDCNV